MGIGKREKEDGDSGHWLSRVDGARQWRRGRGAWGGGETQNDLVCVRRTGVNGGKEDLFVVVV